MLYTITANFCSILAHFSLDNFANIGILPFDGIKTFAEMGLYSLRVPGLSQDLQQLIIRQEIEPRENQPVGNSW